MLVSSCSRAQELTTWQAVSGLPPSRGGECQDSGKLLGLWRVDVRLGASAPRLEPGDVPPRRLHAPPDRSKKIAARLPPSRRSQRLFAWERSYARRVIRRAPAPPSPRAGNP